MTGLTKRPLGKKKSKVNGRNRTTMAKKREKTATVETIAPETPANKYPVRVLKWTPLSGQFRGLLKVH